MNKKFLLIPVAALVVGGGAIAGAQVASDDSPPIDPVPATFQEATLVEEWCDFMDLAFGPDVAVPDVQAAFASAQVDGVATPETAYVALLEGIPDEIEPSFATIRVAGQRLVDEDAITNPVEVSAAASEVDSFMATNCGT